MFYSVLSLFLFSIYLSTIPPTITLEDSGELISTAFTGGIAHPSGYPLWTMIGNFFTLFPFGSVAFRVNLSSSIIMVAVCLCFVRFLERLGGNKYIAASTALMLCLAKTNWSQAIIAEVYSLHLLFLVLLTLFAWKWSEEGKKRNLYMFAAFSGLGMANHQFFTMLSIPYGLWALFMFRKNTRISKWNIAGCLAVIFLFLSINLYIPVRGSTVPPVHWFKETNVKTITEHLALGIYMKEGGRKEEGFRGAIKHTGYGMKNLGEELGYLPLLLVPIGLIWLFQRNRPLFIITISVFLLNYPVLNFIQRARFTEIWKFVHRVYYGGGQMVMAIWIAAGAFWILQRMKGDKRNTAIIIISLAILLPTLISNYSKNLRQNDYLAYNFSMDILDTLPENSTLFSTDDNIAFPVTYMQMVEERRPDIQLIGLPWGKQYLKEKTLHEQLDRPNNYFNTPHILLGEDIRLRRLILKQEGILLHLNHRRNNPFDPEHLKSFQEYPYRIPLERDLSTGVMGKDAMVLYAPYFASLGAREHFKKEGSLKSGAMFFEKAKTFSSRDPYAIWFLANIFEGLGIDEGWRKREMKKAFDSYNTKVDPFTKKSYPIPKEWLRNNEIKPYNREP